MICTKNVAAFAASAVAACSSSMSPMVDVTATLSITNRATTRFKTRSPLAGSACFCEPRVESWIGVAY